MPYEYHGSSASTSYIFLVSFYLISSLFAGILIYFLLNKNYNFVQNNSVLRLDQRYVVLAAIFSLLSTLFILYDRMYIQGVDYSQGLAVAREQWRMLGEERQGFSSFYSLIGNLLSGFPIISVALVYLFYESINARIRLILLPVISAALILSVLLTGGRSIVMMFLVTLFLIALLRKHKALNLVPNQLGNIGRFFIFILVSLMLIYTGFVFHLRALAGGDSPFMYMLSTLSHLGGQYTGRMSEDTTFLGAVWYYFTIVSAYLTHSLWTFQSILDLTDHEGWVTFNFFRVNFSRVFSLDLDQGWDFSGLFSTLVGAFYYDYGVVGFIVCSFITGFFIFLGTFVVGRSSLNLLGIALYLSVMYVVFLSPLLFAVDVMSFIFVLFGFLLLYLFRFLFMLKISV